MIFLWDRSKTASISKESERTERAHDAERQEKEKLSGCSWLKSEVRRTACPPPSHWDWPRPVTTAASPCTPASLAPACACAWDASPLRSGLRAVRSLTALFPVTALIRTVTTRRLLSPSLLFLSCLSFLMWLNMSHTYVTRLRTPMF